MKKIKKDSFKYLCKLINSISKKIKIDKVPTFYFDLYSFTSTKSEEIYKGIFKHTGFEDSSKIKKHYLFYKYFKSDLDFTQFDEFQSFLSICLKENKFYKKKVKDKTKFLNDIIKKFIIYMYSDIQKINLSEKEIEIYYNELIDYFMDVEPFLITKCPIEYFYSNRDKIELEENIIIKRIPKNERELLYSNYIKNQPVIEMINLIYFEYFLFIKYHQTEGAINQFAIDMKNEFIKFARIYQENKINIRYMKLELDRWNLDYTSVGGLSGSPFLPIQGKGDYLITDNNIKEFISLWRKYRKIDYNKNKALRIAINRFNYSFQRIEFEDRIIDLMIAFEALFLIDVYNELGFRLSLRTAIFLKDIASERQIIFRFMKKAYSIRSKIIHGGTIDDIIIIDSNQYTHSEFIIFLENILRECLKKFINNYGSHSIKKICERLDREVF